MNIGRDLAKYIVNLAKEQGKKVVFTNGCFDILHVGHISYLENAKRQGDILIVGVNSDESTRRLKGPTRPINNQNDRACMLSALKSVDYTVIFEEDTPEDLIAYLKPSIHVKGGDYKKDDLPETKIVEAYGGKVVILNFVEGKSTTNIINKINNN
ncbi:MAG: D-glycero-beta-D-manno-heptose 1-phosphate adenylyltransferase [Fusobacterium sp.]|uniref:D-glycero-beta-D-manno-heptose 1-phosphate adenylyltransferase n=1 Tax=Fusobacterium sp. TaxID=68766 RepID=UPI0026DD3FEE|nr:D-glycero-beta-D-manno-heptose 1-phosphate adenylyltransferase [Fusobacterium sp.]MDO4690725.1 D-glycero-beta-D-manno-heptose 1-phosphate adenylyltransferase [Fusobacterium sp.]